MLEPLPPADYYAFVSREERRPSVEVYYWALQDPLPRIPVPLAKGDPDAVLDLQEAVATVYDRARYDYGLRYDVPVVPELPAAGAAWVR